MGPTPPTHQGNVFISLGIALGLISLLTKYINDICLTDEQNARFRERFEAWWLSAQYWDKQQFALSLAEKMLSVLNSSFGPKLLSARFLRRSFCVSTLLLFASFGTIGIFNGEIAGISPWATYSQAMSWVRTNWDNLEQKFISPELTREEQQQSRETFDKLRSNILHFDTKSSRIIYSVLFFLILTLANFALFPISLAFSRKILREVLLAKTVFTCFSLLLANLVFLWFLYGTLLVFLWVFALPALWFGTALVALILWQVKILYFAALPVAIPFAWTFSPPAIKSIALIGFCPCILTLLATSFTVATLRFRDVLHAFVSAVLFRCATKGPLVILFTTITLIVTLISLLSRWLGWPS